MDIRHAAILMGIIVSVVGTAPLRSAEEGTRIGPEPGPKSPFGECYHHFSPFVFDAERGVHTTVMTRQDPPKKDKRGKLRRGKRVRQPIDVLLLTTFSKDKRYRVLYLLSAYRALMIAGTRVQSRTT